MSKTIIGIIPILWLVASCGPAETPLVIRFQAVYGANPLACRGAGNGLTDLRFYVNDVALLRADGGRAPLQLDDRPRWQGQGIALVDLEDGTGNCANGTPDSNAEISGRVAAGDYTGLSFSVGVPFELNHADPLGAGSPLDDMSMHWHWRSGYKFLRAAVKDDRRQASMHLGSAGCRGRVTAIESCDFPNRLRVTLEDWRPGQPVSVDLAALIRALPADSGALTHCESGPADPNCAVLLPVVGIDAASGLDNGQQALFRAGG